MKTGFAALRTGLMLISILVIFALNYRDLFRPKRLNRTRGTIDFIDVSSRVLVVQCDQSPGGSSFAWHAETQFCDIDGIIKPEDVQPGHRVNVVYATERGQLVASRIEIEPVYEQEARCEICDLRLFPRSSANHDSSTNGQRNPTLGSSPI